MDNHSRMEKYVNAIGIIADGQRNSTLYSLGLSLRTKFGLIGRELESALSQANDTKCDPPLSIAEITSIARSVDKSDTSVWEGADGINETPQQSKCNRHSRSEYSVILGADAVTVSDILKKDVSLYKGCIGNTPTGTSNIERVLDTIRTGGKLKEQILAVRNESDKAKRDKMKKQLPAVVFGSEPQPIRTNEACKHNGVYCFDFDDIDDVEKAKADIAALPYVFAVGVSVSSKGVFALIHYEGTPHIANLLIAIQSGITYKIDTARSDLCGLRFVSFDEHLIIKDKVYPVILTERTEMDGEPAKADFGKKRSKNGDEIHPRLVLASDVKEKAIAWLWANKIPCGMLSLIAGLAGVGKSFWTVYMTTIITNGWDWADGSPCEQGSVLFFYGEEGIADTYKKRFRGNGVDQSKVVFLDGMEKVDKNDERSEVTVTLNMTDAIERAIEGTAKKTGLPVKMVVIDPVANYWGGIKENSNAEVRAALKPLQHLAEKTGVAFVLIQHVGKGDKEHAQQRILGSTGIVAACRAVWGVYVANDDKSKRIFVPVKVNCGYDHTAVSFWVAPPDGKVKIIDAKIKGLTGDDIESERRQGQQRGRKPTELAKIEAWLLEVLANGEKPAKEIYKLGEANNFSPTTINRAKKALGIASIRERNTDPWLWVLPKDLPPDSGEVSDCQNCD